MSGKSKIKHVCIICIAFLALCLVINVKADPTPISLPSVDMVYSAITDLEAKNYDPPGSELTDRGRNVRGVYLPVSKIKLLKNRELVRWITRRIGADAVIIDIKDDRGRITFTGDIEGGNQISNALSRRVPDLVERLKNEDVYVIGRLVCFKDNLYPRANPKDAIRDRRTRKTWKDRSGLTWIDPYSESAREYIASIAKAAEDTGFDEIQLDYVRFPVEPAARNGLFPSQVDDMKRYEAIQALLARVDKEIGLPLSIDVFGLTAYNSGDSDGLGQSLEHLAPHIDAISPMLYLANWPKRIWENPKPKKTHSLVHNAVLRIRSRLGDQIAVRPLLQGFKYRAENFGAGFIQNQINAATTAGSSGYLFWNQAGNYVKLATVWRHFQKTPLKPRIMPHILTPKNAQ